MQQGGGGRVLPEPSGNGKRVYAAGDVRE